MEGEYTTLFGQRLIKSIRFEIQNGGNCPSWHLGNGNPSWLFLDELIIR